MTVKNLDEVEFYNHIREAEECVQIADSMITSASSHLRAAKTIMNRQQGRE